ncbi:MAG: M28 family peptidase, partial [Promethearchaeota archaeon]
SPVPGANDGASGSAVLIELARALYNRSADLSVQIWFLFFDAEDQGYDRSYGINGWDWCEGSNKFVVDIENFYNLTHERIEAMILLDMVGGIGLKFIKEQYSTSSLLDELFETGRQLGYESEFPINAISQSITDDHVPFVNYGIPSADLIINFWQNPNWPYHHTIDDNLQNISNFSLEVTGRTVEQFIYNNYMDPNDEYHGNYPWKGDLNLPDTTSLIIILTITVLIGIFSIMTLILKKFKKKPET